MTGILSDAEGITRLLHAHGALAFWDYAAGGPYIDIDMNPGGDPAAAKDAVFLSPHKFIGGPGTPGLLIVRRELLANRVPDVVGGGTVAYVSPTEHTYLTDPEHREEGGTPAIIESIRAGLVFDLKRAVGTDVIRAHEEDLVHRAVAAWSANPAIGVLGNVEADRLSIVSFTVRGPSGRYLHHNAIVAMLNDVFGIQARGGCSCAGPYGHRLLGISLDRSAEFEEQISVGLRGDQARVGARQLQLLHLRGGLHLPRRGRRPDRAPRVGTARGLPIRHRNRPVEAPRRAGRAARCDSRTCTTTPPGSSPARATTIVPTRRRWSSTWPTARALLAAGGGPSARPGGRAARRAGSPAVVRPPGGQPRLIDAPATRPCAAIARSRRGAARASARAFSACAGRTSRTARRAGRPSSSS